MLSDKNELGCYCCANDASHLDLKLASIIMPENGLEKDWAKIFQEYVNYDANPDLKDYRLYAVTFTLSVVERRACSKRGIDTLNFLTNKLIDKNYSGVYVVERDKKGVRHLHGIVYGHRDILYHKCKKGFYLSEWGASNILKPLYKSNMSYQKWYEYCAKTLLTLDVERWLNMSN